ncbi:RRM domain-containing protein [Aphelenchoides besseyi]|nr:RRM domain-containing protein [Aphelenchoides besseyi]
MSSREDVMNGNGVSTIRVLQISNISPSATKEQIQTLFSFVGRIEDIRIYPNEGVQAQQRFAYVKFDRPAAVELGQHLTNVVFIDLALVCVPAPSNTIPDEETALRSGPALPGQRQLPPNVVSSTQVDADGQEMLYTVDPTMTALGVAQYPPLPANTEPSKVEEIRRTVYIGGLKKKIQTEKS